MAHIAIDVMGGDHAPGVPIRGACLALDSLPHVERLLLVGCEDVVGAELKRLGRESDERIEVVHAEEAVAMHEPASTALRKKRNSSIAVCADLVKSGRAQALASAGHTGASVASTVVKWRCLPGIERPGIATVLPAPSGPFVLLDAGANVDAKPRHLLHYAVMGDVYAKDILGIESPRVGLLSVGEEEGKGNELTKDAYELIAGAPHVNFVGNVEGNELFSGQVDVVVCDGFVGNVVLKCSESLAKVLTGLLKEKILANPVRKAGAYLCRGALRELRDASDYKESGGAPLLGVNGICIIGHGSSCETAIKNVVRVSAEFVEHHVNQHIVDRVAALNGHDTSNASA